MSMMMIGVRCLRFYVGQKLNKEEKQGSKVSLGSHENRLLAVFLSSLRRAAE